MASLPAVLYLRPSDPSRTAIAEYSRHFLKALRGVPGIEVIDFLPEGLVEKIDRREERQAVERFVTRRATEYRDVAGPALVHVEMGNALHREFWAARALQNVLPRARFLCTVHDPPTLCSNPYRYVRTEFAGATPLRLFDIGLTRAAEMLVEKRWRRIERAFIANCDDILVLAREGQRLLSDDPRFHSARVHHLPHVFDLDSLPPIRDPRRTAEPLIVLFGFLVPGKGVEDAIEAFERTCDRLEGIGPVPRLRVFGGVAGGERGAEYVRSLEKRIAVSPRRERILFEPGFVPDGERDRQLAEAEILLLPARRAPTAYSSAGVIRAMALGKALVAANANTVAEMVDCNRNGLLYQEGNIQDMSRSLERLCLDSSHRETLGRNARRTIEKAHSVLRVAETLAEVYERVVSEAGG
ncbi:glycosyltransferase family 4 protein [bacterium]|nr:glycosyltransferase family 4 protein [bacterium]